MKKELLCYLILLFSFCRFLEAEGNIYFVSSSGNDRSNGSYEYPWATVEHALTKLSSCDVLNLRQGIYYENSMHANISGKPGMRITIQSYAGERAVIDGGVPFFKKVPNSEWEVVDPDIGLYRTKRTFSGRVSMAWLLDYNVQLIEYDLDKNIKSTNYESLEPGTKDLYIGPGVRFRDDGHIYIRLQQNPLDLKDIKGRSVEAMPKDTDPNNNRIALYTSFVLFSLDNAKHVTFRNLDLVHSYYIMELKDSSNNIELDNCFIKYGRYGILSRGAGDTVIRNCTFCNGVPDWIYWTDVKSDGRKEKLAEAYPEFQSCAINGAFPDCSIHHNIIMNVFDGMLFSGATTNSKINDNTIYRSRDDAININKDCGNLEVARNMIRHCFSGISILPSDGTGIGGDVYIHHNVIDISKLSRGGRQGNRRKWKTWMVIAPFSTHNSGDKAGHWKIYNNTVVARRAGHKSIGMGTCVIDGNTEKYVYNNIFFAIDNRTAFGREIVSNGSHFNGNIFWQADPGNEPMFNGFGDNNRYFCLKDFRNNSGTDWEIDGLQIDPGLDIDLMDSEGCDLGTVWEIYRPDNKSVFTPGSDYSGLNWPCVEGINYRGALPEKRSQ